MAGRAIVLDRPTFNTRTQVAVNALESSLLLTPGLRNYLNPDVPYLQPQKFLDEAAGLPVSATPGALPIISTGPNGHPMFDFRTGANPYLTMALPLFPADHEFVMALLAPPATLHGSDNAFLLATFIGGVQHEWFYRAGGTTLLFVENVDTATNISTDISGLTADNGSYILGYRRQGGTASIYLNDPVTPIRTGALTANAALTGASVSFGGGPGVSTNGLDGLLGKVLHLDPAAFGDAERTTLFNSLKTYYGL